MAKTVEKKKTGPAVPTLTIGQLHRLREEIDQFKDKQLPKQYWLRSKGVVKFTDDPHRSSIVCKSLPNGNLDCSEFIVHAEYLDQLDKYEYSIRDAQRKNLKGISRLEI